MIFFVESIYLELIYQLDRRPLDICRLKCRVCCHTLDLEKNICFVLLISTFSHNQVSPTICDKGKTILPERESQRVDK